MGLESIKKDLTNPPVLVMPNDKGHFILVSDTSAIGCGATLYQQIDGEYRVVAYYSKKLPEAVKRYSISELELTGMLANITAFKHILRNVNFTVYCDHSALEHIIKAIREPPALRLQNLVEHLMDYKFSMKFMKGKEMFVPDFLSRNPDNNTQSTNEIIPIAFILKDATETWDETKPMTRRKLKIVNAHHCSKYDENLFVMTKSMAKTQGAAIPQMYPLKGDHNLPEVSKGGMIQLPVTAIKRLFNHNHSRLFKLNLNHNNNSNQQLQINNWLQIFPMLLIQHLLLIQTLFIQHSLLLNLLLKRRGRPGKICLLNHQK